MNVLQRAGCWGIVVLAGLSLASRAALGQQPATAAPAQAAPQRAAAPQIEPPPPPPNTLLGPGEEPIDLATALQLAGAENPQLLLARERLTEAAARRMLAAAQLLPNLNYGSNYDLHRGPLQQSNGNILKVHRDALYAGLGVNAIAAGTVSIPGIQYNLNVGTAWFDWLQRRQNLARASAATRTANNNVMLDVALAYSNLLRAETMRAIALQNRTEMAEVARVTAAYANTGQGRKADADRAAVEVRRRDAELVQAEGEILAASARLAQLLSLDPTTRLKPIDGFAVPAPIVPEQVPLPELIAMAIMQRPELAERRAEIEAALVALSAARFLPFSPNAIVGFSSGTFGGGSNLISNPPGFINGSGDRIEASRFGRFDGRTDFDVVAYWTLQNLGFGNRANVQINASLARQADLQQLATMNQVRTEVAQAYARSRARTLQIDTVAVAMDASREAFDEDFKRTRAGAGLPIEVIDSLRLLARSRTEYLDAIIQYNQAQFQLYVALGEPPADGLVRPVPPSLTNPAAPPEELPPVVRPDQLPRPQP
jgi:outer membrane protein TolC